MYMVLQISCYHCGAILLRTKEIRSKRMHRLVSVKVDYILTFSSPEAMLLLVSSKNRDLWEGPIFLACAE